MAYFSMIDITKLTDFLGNFARNVLSSRTVHSFASVVESRARWVSMPGLVEDFARKMSLENLLQRRFVYEEEK